VNWGVADGAGALLGACEPAGAAGAATVFVATEFVALVSPAAVGAALAVVTGAAEASVTAFETELDEDPPEHPATSKATEKQTHLRVMARFFHASRAASLAERGQGLLRDNADGGADGSFLR
jgi:hypothetical protein